MSDFAQGKNTLTFGGLSVIGGVMIHNDKVMAMAVREPSGGIALTTWTMSPATDWRRWASRIPFVRGLASLGTTLENGRQMVNHSLRASDKTELNGMQVQRRDFVSAGLLVFFLLFVLPSLIVLAVGWFAPDLVVPPWGAILEALLRVGVFVGFVALAAPIAEQLGGVLSYHGAEHQAIHAYEADAPLTLDGTGPFGPLHPRCGTNHALTIVVVASLVFGLLNFLPLLPRIAAEVVAFFLIAGSVPELLMLASKHWQNPIVRALSFPGIALQLITTRMPRLEHREVALAALRGALETSQQSQPNFELMILLRDANVDVRTPALVMLGASDPRAASNGLRELLTNGDLLVRWRAILLMAQSGTLTDGDLMRGVAPLLTATEPQTRANTVGQLSRFGAEVLAPYSDMLASLVVPLLQDELPAARANAAYLLGQLRANAPTRAAIPMLIALLDDADSQVRGNVIHLLGVIGAIEAAVATDVAIRIAALLFDNDDYVQWNAVQAVVWLRYSDAIPALQTLAASADEKKRAMLLQAIQYLATLVAV